jgi:hypothetical protein
MIKSRKIYAAVAIILAGLGAFVMMWIQQREIVALRTATTLSKARQSALQFQLDQSEKRAKQLAAELATLQQAQVRYREAITPLAATEADAAAARDGSGGSNVVERAMARLKDPEVSRLMFARARTQIGLRYSGLLSRLKMAPMQNAKFLDLMAEKQTASFDMVNAASEKGITDINELGSLHKKMQADLDGELKAMMGESAYTQYLRFTQTQNMRDLLGTLQQSLAPAGAPLTNVQYGKMIEILSETGPRSGQGSVAMPSSASALTNSSGSILLNNNPGAQVTDDTILRAQAVLQPFQLQALKAIQQAQQIELALKAQFTKQAGGRSGANPTRSEPPPND